MAGNRLYLDYIAGVSTASAFYTHSPMDFAVALASRRSYPYPRREVSRLLASYNANLGAHTHAMASIEALLDTDTFCVIAGNQVGFLGGPVYTAYKIITTIRLAARLQAELGVRCVPMFWLASEDHDFNEINHIYLLKSDGEVGQIKFSWDKEGNPVSDLPLSEDVRRAYQEYFGSLLPDSYLPQVEPLFTPRLSESYCTWHARLWSQLFSRHGLVLVEPWVIRPLGGGFLRFALEHTGEIGRRLADIAQRLAAAGYSPALTSERAGYMYTFDLSGRRVRVEEPQEHLTEAEAHPERYSTDAVLRPLFVDAILPVVADVLGAGEIAYQAMLKPLHELFAVPQPLLFPRKHYTVVAKAEADLIARYGTSVADILCGRFDLDAAFRNLMPADELALFVSVRHHVEEALTPLRPYVESVDPGLGQTWAGTLANAVRGLDKLEERTLKARLSQLGLSKQHLQALRNALLPRGRLQERVLPLPHFLARYGLGFLKAFFSAGHLEDFSHHILTLEEGDV